MNINVLIQHIEHDNLAALFGNETYNEVLRSLYLVIRRAVTDGADSLILTPDRLVWRKGHNTLGQLSLNYPEMFSRFRTALHNLLFQDDVIRVALEIVSETENTVVCRLSVKD